MSAVARLRQAIRTHGSLGTLRLAAGLASRPLLRPLQQWWVSRYLRVTGRRFDRQFHVNTTGWIDGEKLDGGANALHATAYAGVVPAPFRMVMDQLKIDFAKHVFIDFGSGKGRALFLAAQYPFARIVGVEFSPQLHEVARANCQTCRGPIAIDNRIELYCMDATKYELPAQPAVLFFFNPFDESVMRPIADQVQESLRRNPRHVLIVYFWPVARRLWDALDCLVTVPVRQPTWAWPAHRGREIVAIWTVKPFT